jgi:hypothetical protein
MSDETLNEILMRVAMTYTGDTTSYPFNEAMRRAAQFYLDGGGVIPPYIAGRFYSTSVMATSSGIAAATGVVRLYPFQLPRSITVSALMARVNTVGLGSFQLAIYANDSTKGRPVGDVLARTGDISSTSLAAVTADITGADVVLEPGIYWGAVNVDATTAVATFQTLNANNAGTVALFGAIDAATAASGAGSSLVTLTTPMAYNTWSSMTPAVFTEVGGANGAAHIWLKAA